MNLLADSFLGVPREQWLLDPVKARDQALRSLGCRLAYMETNRGDEITNAPDQIIWDNPIASARVTLMNHDARVWTKRHSLALDILIAATDHLPEPGK